MNFNQNRRITLFQIFKKRENEQEVRIVVKEVQQNQSSVITKTL
ncbi:unnamed protein product [Paramecium sonneborni]|uniref:Uncharacterized protein n=1 Tax=Paramecium sonneborni TaxID=65129 RepID=A0A8S1NLT2_9CILI|nr:unnamed protein product [Paramecium sonneborni]